GIKVFDECKENLVWKQTRIEDSIQPPLKAPFARPDNRDAFWKDLQTEDFEIVAKHYGEYGQINAVKKKARDLKRQIARIVKG
ncbi:MAG: coenzyme F420 hydrogenase, partial [Ruminococcus sp.]|nr:coenzyme F420 hydrogenase [Ruminococcus sp.]